jgi:16S rRNA (guanine966-N2)-methyltransferase
MRIVGGEWRGRVLVAPPGRGTRPTSDRVREAMFDVLQALPEAQCAHAHGADADGARPAGSLAGHVVLDLFAGSGALGLEALSRGAERCSFVESAGPALRALRGNLERLHVPVTRAGGPPAAAAPGGSLTRAAKTPPRGSATVLATDVRRALAADARREARYTLVFADPPYDRYEEVRPALARLLGRVLASGAVLVVESGAGTTGGLPWPVVREKRYGDTKVTFHVAGAPRPAEGEAADDDR